MRFIRLRYLIGTFLISILFVNAQTTAKIKLVDPTKSKGCTPLLLVDFDGSGSLPIGSKVYEWDFGNGNKTKGDNLTSVSASYTSSGVYKIKLKVIDISNPAIFSYDSTFVTVNQSPKASFAIDGRSSGCAPLSINLLNTSIAGSGSSLSYRWDFGDGDTSTKANDIHIYKNKNSYSPLLLIRDNNGCQSSASLPVGQTIVAGDKPKALFSVLGPTVSCSTPFVVNFKDQSVLTGLSGPFKYEWDFGDGAKNNINSNPTNTYNSVGQYTIKLKITDESSNCADSITTPNLINVVNQNITISSNLTNACSPKLINFSGSVVPTLVGQTVRWNFGGLGTAFGNTPAFNFAIPGTYDVTLQTVGPVASCEKISTPIKITILPKPTDLKLSVNQLNSCKPISLDFTGSATNATTYQWTFTGATPNTSSVQNPSGISFPLGVFTPKLKVTNSVGCSDSISNQTIRIQAPIANFSGPTSLCLGSNANFNDLSTSVEPVSIWEWDLGDGSPIRNGKNQTYKYTALGSYTVRLTITTSGGCQSTKTMLVNVIEKPDATIGPFTPLNICNNTLVSFVNNSVGVADSYRWVVETENPVNQLTKLDLDYTYKNGTATNDVILYAFKGGCSDTAIIKAGVTVLPPKPDFTVTVPNCTNDSVSFVDKSTAGIVKWSWNFGTGFAKDTSNKQNPKFLFPTSGSYKVTLTATHSSGCADFKTVDVVVPDYANNVNISQNKVNGCAPLAVNFSTTTVASAYNWTFGNGTVENVFIPKQVIYTKPGKYVVKLTVTNVRGCKYDRTTTINVTGPLAKLTTNISKGCAPLLINAKDLSTDSVKITGRSWDFGNGFSLVGNDSLMSYTYTQATAVQKTGFKLKLTVSDILGCKASDSLQIIPSKPTASFTEQIFKKCAEDSIVLTAKANDSIGIQPFMYLWKFSDSSSASSRITNKKLSVGVQNISLLLTDANGCSSKTNKTLNVNALAPKAKFCAFPTGMSCPAILDSIVAVCPPLIIDFISQSVKGKSGIKNYFWDFGDGTKSSLPNPSRTYTKVGNYTVKLTVVDSIGCSDTYVFENLVKFKGPKAIITNNAVSCNGAEVTFKAVQVTTKKEKLSFSWNFGNGEANVSGQEVKYTFKTPGPKYINLFYEDTFKTCSLNEQDTLVINGLELINLRADTTVCEGEVVEINGETLGAKYKWNTGATSPIIVINQPGKYSLEIKDTISGCTSKDSVQISYSPKPNIIIDAQNNNNCSPSPSGKITLKTSKGAPFSFAWSDRLGASIGNKDSIINVTGGLYKVNVLNSLGCIKDTSIIIKNVPANFNLSLDTLIDIVKCEDKGKITILAAAFKANEKISLPFDSVVWVNNLGKKIRSVTNFQPELSNMRGYDVVANEADSIYFSNDTLQPGSYSLAIYKQEVVPKIGLIGCPKVIGPFLINPPRRPVVNLGNDIKTCDTSLTLSSQLTIRSKFTWSNSSGTTLSNSSSLTANKTGKYILNVEDSISGCIAVDSISLLFNKTPKVSIGKEIDTCVNIPTNIIATTDIGNSFKWFELGNSTQIGNKKELLINPTSALGTSYLVIVTDTITGCNKKDSIKVNFTDLPLLNVTTTTNILCKTDTAAIDAIALPTTDSFTWEIDSAGVSGNLINFKVSPEIGKSSYVFTAIDQRGCRSIPDSVVLKVVSNPKVNIGQDTAICFKNFIDFKPSVSLGTGKYNYNWSTSETTKDIRVKPNSSDLIILDVTDSLGCRGSDSLKLTVLTLPTIQISSNDTICLGDTALVAAKANGNFKSFNYYWTNSTANISTKDSVKVNPIIDTKYLVYVVDSNSCSSDTLSTIISINRIPQISLGNDTSVCFGNIALLKAIPNNGGLINQLLKSEDYKYDWSSNNDSGFIGKDTSRLTISPSQTYKYFVAVNDGRCKSLLDSVIINVNALPQISLGEEIDTCVNIPTSIVATTDIGNSFKWFELGNNTQISDKKELLIKPTSALGTSYLVIVTDTITGCNKKDSIKVNFTDLPLLNVTTTTNILCKTDTAAIDAIALPTTDSFTWEIDSAGVSGNLINFKVSPEIGKSSYVFTAIDQRGCRSISDSVVLKVVSNPKVNIGRDTAICFKNFIDFKPAVSLGTGKYNYNWSTSETTKDIRVTPNSTDLFILSVTDSLACRGSDSLKLTVLTLPTIQISSNDTICLGDTALVAAKANGNFKSFNYYWTTSTANISTKDTVKVNPIIDTKYLVYVVDSNNCSSETLSTIISVNRIPQVSLGNDTSICFGNIALLKAIPSNGGLFNQTLKSEEYTYDWSSNNDSGFIGQDTSRLTISPSQTYKYFVAVNDGRCKSLLDSVIINVNTLPDIKAGQSQTVCKGDSVSLTSSGNANLKFTWFAKSTIISNDSIFKVPNVAHDSVFVIEVVDNNGCKNQDSTEIKTLNKPNLNLPTHVCLDSSKTYLLESQPISDKINNASYTWFVNKNEQPSANSLIDSTFEVKFSSTFKLTYGIGNCVVSDSTEITYNPFVKAGDDRIVCVGDTIKQTAFSNQIVTYKWFTKDNTNIASTNKLTLVAIKDSLLFASVEDQKNCMAKDSFDLKVHKRPILSLPSTICLDSLKNDSLRAYPIQNPISGANFNWFKNKAPLNPLDLISDSVIAIFDTAQYNVTYGLGECYAYDTSAVHFNPVVSLVDSQVVCINDIIRLKPITDVSNKFKWYDGNNFTLVQSIELNAPIYSDSTIYLSVTNNKNCTITKEVIIQAFQKPIIPVFLKYCFDQGDTLLINARPVGTEIPKALYEWRLKDTVFSNAAAQDTIKFLVDTGNYQINYGLKGCIAKSDFKVSWNPLINIGVANLTLCNSDTLKISGETNDANLVYTWESTNNQALSSDSLLTIPIVQDTVLFLKVENSMACESRDTLKIKTYSKPSISLPSHLCYSLGDAFLLDATPLFSNLPAGEYQWSLNGFPLILSGDPSQDQLVTATDTGTYHVVYGQGKCVDTSTTKITLSPKIVLPVDTAICFGKNILLNAQYLENTGVGKIKFTWNSDEQFIENDSLNTLAISDTSKGSYNFFVAMEAKDSLGCIDEDSVFIVVNKPVPVAINYPLTCLGDTVSLLAVPSVANNQSYVWYNNKLPLDTTSQVKVATTGLYALFYTELGCTDSTKANITFYDKPINNNEEKYTFCKDASEIGRLDTGTVLIDAGNFDAFNWENGETTRSIRVNTPGSYAVKISNQFGCFILDTIHVYDVCPPRVNVPNAFSPNGDENNDYFDIYTAYTKNFKLWIYNRWGEVVYYTEEASKPWDGKQNGAELETGTYPWLLQYDGVNEQFGKKLKKSGKVTLVK